MTRTAESLLKEGRIVCLIAKQNEQPIGVLGLNDCAAIYAGGEFGEITELYVLPEFRSMTVASQLIGGARAIAQEREWKRLEVCAPMQPAWDRTLRFYLREGFQEVGPRLIFRL